MFEVREARPSVKAMSKAKENKLLAATRVDKETEGEDLVTRYCSIQWSALCIDRDKCSRTEINCYCFIKSRLKK